MGIAWEEGEYNKGSEVTSYRVSFSKDGGPYQVLASVSTTQFTAFSLMPGSYYSFKVQSKNSYGFSDYSEQITMLCAFVPSAPEAPSTEVINSDVLISWPETNENGSPITGFKIFIQQHNSDTFVAAPSSCDGQSEEAL